MTLFRTLHSIRLFTTSIQTSPWPGPCLCLGSMAKLERVEKTLREAAGITQLKDMIPINAHVIHAEITSCKHCYYNSSGTQKCDPFDQTLSRWVR